MYNATISAGGGKRHAKWGGSVPKKGRDEASFCMSSKQGDPNPNNNSLIRNLGCKRNMESLIC